MQASSLTCASTPRGWSLVVWRRRQHDGTFSGEELTVRHWGLNPAERARVQAQRNGHVDITNADGYLSVASGRWKACTAAVQKLCCMMRFPACCLLRL